MRAGAPSQHSTDPHVKIADDMAQHRTPTHALEMTLEIDAPPAGVWRGVTDGGELAR